MRINHQNRLDQAKAALEQLQKSAPKAATVSTSAIQHAGLRAVARQIQTGCSSSVAVKDLKETIKTLGREIKKADGNKDGYITGTEARALSSLAQALLEVAAQPASGGGGRVSTGCGSSSPVTPEPRRPVSTGCGSSSTVTTPRRPVSTGCGSSGTTVTPEPRRPVSTGCGSSGSTVTPAPRRPVSTGCGSSSGSVTPAPRRPVSTGC